MKHELILNPRDLYGQTSGWLKDFQNVMQLSVIIKRRINATGAIPTYLYLNARISWKPNKKIKIIITIKATIPSELVLWLE